MNSTSRFIGKQLIAAGLLSAICFPISAQHSRVSSVVANPSDSTEIWACNRDNGSVSVVDTNTNAVVEIAVGSRPRSIAFSADGSRVFVANQRGDMAIDTSFITPFTGTEIRSSVSVIDVATKTVTDTMLDVGTEPYGVAVSPNGAYLAVSGYRSGTIKFFDPVTLAHLHTHTYLHTLSELPAGKTLADADENTDMIADLAEPRAFVIKAGATAADDTTMYVTHLIPGYVSVLTLTLDGRGRPIDSVVSEKIDLNEYPFHPIFNPVPVQTVESQGTPRFLQDIALSPDGDHALVPHILENLNHDVNFDFGGAIDGDFANRVYPALTVVDTANNSYAAGGDDSARLHHELSEPVDPAAFVPFGEGARVSGDPISLGGNGSPEVGNSIDFLTTGPDLPGSTALLFLGSGSPISVPLGGETGTLYCLPGGTILPLASVGGGSFSTTVSVPTAPAFAAGANLCFQSVVIESDLTTVHLSNGLTVRTGTTGYGQDKMGHRAGHPGRAVYNAAGDRAIMLNRGSEDVFLYEVDGSSMSLMTVFPPRHEFVERAALDTTTPLGDMPLGLEIVEDTSTTADDALVYIVNELTRTLSTLRVNWETGEISKEADQLDLVLGADKFTASEILGSELFEDASRAQTTGRFNNSCASCHFEGGADGNVWQRPAGPRSTMPVYGGPLLTGLILWKGVRLNMGETGPMFGGENGGHGIFSDTEQQALTDYHNVIPVPVNPNLDPLTGGYTANAALGKDLFFGFNDTGLNPTLRRAGCADCHTDQDSITSDLRGYTVDFVDPTLTSGDNLESFDSFCFNLQENVVSLNIRDINSGVNVDLDNDTIPDLDRNADGFPDVETYAPMNVDTFDDFTRDDPNGYLCPLDPYDAMSPLKVFVRPDTLFSIPTKLGVFTTGPYFHDHSIASLRGVLDPQGQQSDPTYGLPAYPGAGKYINEFHDIRGNDMFVMNPSKVQISLQSTDVDADIQALLDYIRSL